MTYFAKYQALGNDYIIIDPARAELLVNKEVATLLCDRHHGIGADGVLYGPFVKDGLIHLQIFNSDGSECQKSGNGLRIFSHYLLAQGYECKERFSLQTLAGKTDIKVTDYHSGIFTVSMGSYSFDSRKIPVTGPERQLVEVALEVNGNFLTIHCLHNGNPHCVVFSDNISPEHVMEIGPAISNHPFFLNGINVQLATIKSRTQIDAEIWERGSGYTLASGSSACAIASVAHTLGYIDSEVDITMPGGKLCVSISSLNEVYLTGEACCIAEGELSSAFQNKLFSLIKTEGK